MILFATQNFLPSIGGTQLYVTGLADALAARGHRIEVFCDAASKTAAAAVDRGRPYPIRRFGGLRPVMRRKKAWALMQRLATGGEVRAVVTDTWKSLEHIPADALHGITVLCLAHGSEFLVPKGSAKEHRMRECLAKATLVAANSRFTADLVRLHLGGKAELRVVLPGVDPPTGSSPEFPMPVTGARRLLTIARLEPRKGIDMVLHALPTLGRECPDVSYDVIGKGDDRARLLQLAERLGVSPRVRFHGYISEQDKADLLMRATLFLMPNRREPGSVEGFGIVFVEAAAFGVPSIAGTDGGTSDAVLHEQTGLVVDGDDPNAVQGAISRLLGNPAEGEKMGAAAHRRFWSEFAWPAAVRRFEDALGLG